MKEFITDAEYEILTKDLSSRASYGTYIQFPKSKLLGDLEDTIQKLSISNLRRICINLRYIVCLPYLRPMDSMTSEELLEVTAIFKSGLDTLDEFVEYIDWLNKKHFDYRGLIKMGLAIEAPEEMYNH